MASIGRMPLFTPGPRGEATTLPPATVNACLGRTGLKPPRAPPTRKNCFKTQVLDTDGLYYITLPLRLNT